MLSSSTQPSERALSVRTGGHVSVLGLGEGHYNSSITYEIREKLQLDIRFVTGLEQVSRTATCYIDVEVDNDVC